MCGLWSQEKASPFVVETKSTLHYHCTLYSTRNNTQSSDNNQNTFKFKVSSLLSSVSTFYFCTAAIIESLHCISSCSARRYANGVSGLRSLQLFYLSNSQDGQVCEQSELHEDSLLTPCHRANARNARSSPSSPPSSLTDPARVVSTTAPLSI